MITRALSVAVCVFVGLGGCSKKSPEPADPAPATPTIEAKTGPVTDGAKPGAVPEDVSTLCATACNKAQRCGSARGPVAGCLDRCQTVSKSEELDDQLEAKGFAAQAACSQVACSAFRGCISRALIGEDNLAKHPAVDTAQAEKLCRTLCNKEQECHPERADKRGGPTACHDACLQVQVSPDPTMASQRAIMSRSLGCAQSPCDAFEACVKAALLQ